MVEKKWKLIFEKGAQQDAKKIKSSNLIDKVNRILDVLEIDPFSENPRFKQLKGDLSGCYSRRINIQHRIVYQVEEENNTVRVISMFGHY